MFVYVIRWESRISDEPESGTFDVCYADKEKARAKMEEDFENTLSEWRKSEDGDLVEARKGKSGDFCEIHVDGEDYYDYYEWYVDKLEVEG